MVRSLMIHFFPKYPPWDTSQTTTQIVGGILIHITTHKSWRKDRLKIEITGMIFYLPLDGRNWLLLDYREITYKK